MNNKEINDAMLVVTKAFMEKMEALVVAKCEDAITIEVNTFPAIEICMENALSMIAAKAVKAIALLETALTVTPEEILRDTQDKFGISKELLEELLDGRD